MFYEVRIYNSKGKIKKVLSSAELSSRYWKKIIVQDPGLNPGQSKVKKISRETKRMLDAQIPVFLIA